MAIGQTDCPPDTSLAAGHWAGRFSTSIEFSYDTDGTPAGSSSANMPQVVSGTARMGVIGSIELKVPAPDADPDVPVLGHARATFREGSTRTFADGSIDSRSTDGWLTGGGVDIVYSTEVAPVNEIVWRGAWWTGNGATTRGTGFSTAITFTRPDGSRLHGDGWIDGRPEEPISFTVRSVTCEEVTGTIDPAQLQYTLRDPNVWRVVSSEGTFRLRR